MILYLCYKLLPEHKPQPPSLLDPVSRSSKVSLLRHLYSPTQAAQPASFPRPHCPFPTPASSPPPCHLNQTGPLVRLHPPTPTASKTFPVCMTTSLSQPSNSKPQPVSSAALTSVSKTNKTSALSAHASRTFSTGSKGNRSGSDVRKRILWNTSGSLRSAKRRRWRWRRRCG